MKQSQPTILALANQKGGVGKTTTAVNLAVVFARTGLRTLLVDCDPQGNATTSLGIKKRDLAATSYDLLVEGVAAAAAIVPTGRNRLDLIAADDHLAGAMVELVDRERREYQLAGALQSPRGYDLVLLDCPPSLGLITINALVASRSVLIPLQCEYLALEGLAQLKSTIERVRESLNPQLGIIGVAMTMFDGRTNLAQQVVNEVRRFFPKKSAIRSSRVVCARARHRAMVRRWLNMIRPAVLHWHTRRWPPSLLAGSSEVHCEAAWWVG